MGDHVLSNGLDVVFFGSDGEGTEAAAYHRGILRALSARGHGVTVHFGDPAVLLAEVPGAGRADVILRASGDGVVDAMLDSALLAQRRPSQLIFYWDAHAPSSLRRLAGDSRSRYRARIPRFDLVFTAGGGDAVVRGYEALGARRCVPLHVAIDPDAQPAAVPSAAFVADLSVLAPLSPGGDASRVEAFFFAAARALPERRFVLGGSGWGGAGLPDNVRWVGDVAAAARGAFHASAGVVLDVGREGGSPDARLLEAACAGACIISDAWEGLDRFLTPGREVLVARDGQDVARLLRALGPGEARAIGQAARGARGAHLRAAGRGARALDRPRPGRASWTRPRARDTVAGLMPRAMRPPRLVAVAAALAIAGSLLYLARRRDPPAPIPAASASAPSTTTPPPPRPAKPAGPAELALVAPLAKGSDLGGFEVQEIDGVEDGTMRVVCAKDRAEVRLFVALADEEGALPPATAGKLAVFYGARGAPPEDAERLAKKLADVIVHNQGAAVPEGMTTYKPKPKPGTTL